MSHVLKQRPSPQEAQRPCLRTLRGTIILLVIAGLSQACKPDDSPLKAEIEKLKKQIGKQESMLLSLQDSNKVMQQQIDLLNGELREAEKKTKAVESERKKLKVKVKSLSAQNRKLSAKATRAIAESAQAAKAVRVEDKGAQTRELLHPLPAAAKAAEEALGRNGYSLRVSLKTKTRAVFVTNRKVSPPASLELSGFRNQYLVSLHSLPSNGTLLSVKADFERTGQSGRVLAAGPDETAEIERRLINEISKKLANSKKAKK